MRVVLVALAALVCGLLLGCDAGPFMKDVQFDYRPAENLPLLDPVVRDVEVRLLLARVPADVKPIGGYGVRVVVDEAYADIAQRLLAWRGGLTIYRLDAKGDPVGSAVLDFAGASVASNARNLLVVVPTAPAMGVPTVGAVEKVVNDLGDERLAFVRDTHVLWTGKLGDAFRPASSGTSLLVIPRGGDIYGFWRARRDARLMLGRALPKLVLEERRILPPDRLLSLACIVVPVLVGLAWLLFVRRFDRARAEPWWLVLTTFALGAAGGELAGVIERLLARSTPYLDPEVMTLDGSSWAFPVTLAVYTVAVGFVEEGTKLLATLFAARRREFDEPVDGIVYAAVAAIGFGVDENVGYFSAHRLGDGLVALRSLQCIPMHLMLSAIWGYALGKRLVSKRARVLVMFGVAAVLHGADDALISYGVPRAGLLFTVGLTAVFVTLLRKALQWGAVDEVGGEDAPLSSTRQLFAVGNRPGFLLSVTTLFLLAAGLVSVGQWAENEGTRLDAFVLVVGSGLLLGLGLAAYGVARCLPLNVAIDAVGVTFAGALRRWSDIRAMGPGRSGMLVLEADPSDLTIGPADATTLATIDAAIRAREPIEPDEA